MYRIFGYKTHVNGGGVSRILATLVGNDRETLEELEPIQFLLLGVSTDLGRKNYRYNNGCNI